MASRDGGKRTHLGRDYIALEGDEAIFPIHSVIEQIGVAYTKSALSSIHLRGVGEHRGLIAKVLYVGCEHQAGYEGRVGERLGTVQSLQEKYPGITNHVHLEVMATVDPEGLMEGAHVEFGGSLK